MQQPTNPIRAYSAYLTATAINPQQRNERLETTPISRRPRVQIIDFRDEVFASLRAELEKGGYEVGRSTAGALVAEQIRHFSPDLILVFESMPDESGWLIASKIRLQHLQSHVWLYTAVHPHLFDSWKELSGVETMIPYGGDLERLLMEIRERLQGWSPPCASPRAMKKNAA